MPALILALLAVPLIDMALKFTLRHSLGSRAVALGPFGSVRIVAGRMWLASEGRSNSAALWALWMLAAGALIIASAGIPSSGLFVGLLLGGSLSNALESSLKGRVSDYVCLRFWPAFNLADVALAAGAIGVLVRLLAAVQGTLS